ncbi:MAG: YfiR family protein [Raineya sp.]|nr:YfiR family protein [Raineya sp.]MDW8296993.1 YfiR family protein [Raineya sp.]
MRRIFYSGLFYIFLSCIQLVLAQPNVRNYAHHPVYIYNFCKFTQWPAVKTELKIGVLGNSPLYEGLKRMAATKSTYNLKFIVEKYNNPNEIKDCDVLFIPFTTPFDVKEIAQKLVSKNVMLITEDEKYVRDACFNFVVKEGKLMYQVNKQQCDRAKLKVSTKLLSLGILVE